MAVRFNPLTSVFGATPGGFDHRLALFGQANQAGNAPATLTAAAGGVAAQEGGRI
ncbi:MAG: hypothetical protein O2967_00230 [Proteobacteria bacterium]|nr:hypothetical protein [Pseudomonadota bacterium]